MCLQNSNLSLDYAQELEKQEALNQTQEMVLNEIALFYIREAKLYHSTAMHVACVADVACTLYFAPKYFSLPSMFFSPSPNF